MGGGKVCHKHCFKVMGSDNQDSANAKSLGKHAV